MSNEKSVEAHNAHVVFYTMLARTIRHIVIVFLKQEANRQQVWHY